jgi:UDP-glucuronate 4-epimerase
VRALVTGVAGFVGSHLSEALLARGDDVLGVDCFTDYYGRDDKEANLVVSRANERFELVEADLRDADIAALLDGIDVVFHEAAQPGVRLSWAAGFDTYITHNVLATQRLLEAVREARPGARVVNASSSSVYGNQARYPTTEDDLPRPYSPYGVTKLAAEHLCNLYAENWKLATVSLRFFTVYGPRQRPDMSIHRLCESALRRVPFPRYGDGSQIREFTYVDDIVRGNLAAADADVPPMCVINLAGGGEIRLNDLITLVAQLARADVQIDDARAMPGDARRNGGAIDRARALLGWEPETTLHDGLVAQLAWHERRLVQQLASGDRDGAPEQMGSIAHAPDA